MQPSGSEAPIFVLGGIACPIKRSSAHSVFLNSTPFISPLMYPAIVSAAMIRVTQPPLIRAARLEEDALSAIPPTWIDTCVRFRANTSTLLMPDLGAKRSVSGGVKIKRGDWVEDPCRIEPANELPVPAVGL